MVSRNNRGYYEYIITKRIVIQVKEEWEQKLEPVLDKVDGGWKGVLLANYAIVSPSIAYPQLRKAAMDGGQSRAFSLYFAATKPNFKKLGMYLASYAPGKIFFS